jgi:hypothetical protein
VLQCLEQNSVVAPACQDLVFEGETRASEQK